MKAVVFAYHEVGARCLQALLDAGVDVQLVITHTDDPNERIWFTSVAEVATGVIRPSGRASSATSRSQRWRNPGTVSPSRREPAPVRRTGVGPGPRPAAGRRR